MYLKIQNRRDRENWAIWVVNDNPYTKPLSMTLLASGTYPHRIGYIGSVNHFIKSSQFRYTILTREQAFLELL